jgi:regulatory protein
VKITNIKQQVRDENRVSIFVDGKYSFSLNLTELLDEKLKVNLEIDEARLSALKKKSDEGKLRMRSMEWLMNRPHSQKEFRDYLRRKKVEPEFVDYLVEYFVTKKLLDDARYAAWLIEVRSLRLKSQRALQAELRSKGVSSQVIDDALQANPLNEIQQLKDIIAKKRRLARYQDDQKLMAYLARQGYGFDDIKSAMSDG